MAKKNYHIDQKAKVVYADFANLTKKETDEVMKYSMFGYTVVNEEAKTRKGVNDAFITAFLADNEEATQKYTELKNGKKGFVGASVWFMRNYKPKTEAGKSAFATVSKKADEIYTKYSQPIQKQNEKLVAEGKAPKEIMPKDEYIRYYYWKYIFDREA